MFNHLKPAGYVMQKQV